MKLNLPRMSFLEPNKKKWSFIKHSKRIILLCSRNQLLITRERRLLPTNKLRKDRKFKDNTIMMILKAPVRFQNLSKIQNLVKVTTGEITKVEVEIEIIQQKQERDWLKTLLRETEIAILKKVITWDQIVKMTEVLEIKSHLINMPEIMVMKKNKEVEQIAANIMLTNKQFKMRNSRSSKS